MLTKNEFVKRARKIHGRRYAYPDPYVSSHARMRIICPQHGVFYKNLYNHTTRKQGCPFDRNRAEKHQNWTGCGELSGRHWKSIQKHATDRNHEFDLTIEYAWGLFLTQDRRCALTGIPLSMHISEEKHRSIKLASWTASLDRIDNNNGYVIGNVQWVHNDINMMKRHYSSGQFYELCLAVVEHYKTNKGVTINAKA